MTVFQQNKKFVYSLENSSKHWNLLKIGREKLLILNRNCCLTLLGCAGDCQLNVPRLIWIPKEELKRRLVKTSQLERSFEVTFYVWTSKICTLWTHFRPAFLCDLQLLSLNVCLEFSQSRETPMPVLAHQTSSRPGLGFRFGFLFLFTTGQALLRILGRPLFVQSSSRWSASFRRLYLKLKVSEQFFLLLLSVSSFQSCVIVPKLCDLSKVMIF